MLDEVPRWALMWLLSGAIFAACKAAVVLRARLSGWRLMAFALAWPGMDPAPFRPHAKAKSKSLSWLPPLFNLTLGVLLLWIVARQFSHPLAAGWVGMTGLIFILHFGSFALLARFWNAVGIPVVPIMRCPIAAVSLTEFWGKRWNLAFRDLTHVFLFQPLVRPHGHLAALWISFAVSGIMHDLVISLPTGAGFGLPTAYFLLQALGISFERRFKKPSWLRTHAFTVLPAFFLFHPPFIERVMLPFFRVIGALP